MTRFAATIQRMAPFLVGSVQVTTTPDAWLSGTDAAVVVASYGTDVHFRALWSLVAGSGEWQRGPMTFVVVWDGLVECRLAQARDYLTPFDWAVALSIALYTTPTTTTEQRPRVRVLIIDLMNLSGSRSFAMTTFPVLRYVAPWVQVYRLEAEEELAQAAIGGTESDPTSYAWARQALGPRALGLVELLKDLEAPDRVLTTFQDEDEEQRRASLRVVAEMWRAHLTRARDRHGVSNLVAPLILAAGLPSDVRAKAEGVVVGNDVVMDALQTLLGTLGLLDVAES